MPEAQKEPIPGKLVAVEGLDGSGKSTQVYLLKRWLELDGYKVFFTEWNSSAIVKKATRKGKKRQLLTPTTFSLIHCTDFADRYEREIRPLLNAGYIVLGQIAATCNQSEFEAAMQQHVFAPLGLTRAGFGRPCTNDRPNEPWLHVQHGKEYEPEVDRERPAEVILAAAGDVHCSIRDLAKFASYELLQAQEKDPHLKPATAKRLYDLMNSKAKDDFSAFGGTPWLAAGVNYVKSENLAIVFAINAGFNINVGRAILKAVRERVVNK